MSSLIDLRSDTVTQPTDAMRQAMFRAEVGDDGFGDDPTVAELEATYARLVNKPAAVFVPSGVMANQIALRVHTRPGDVVLSSPYAHVAAFEMGAAGRNAGVQFAFVDVVQGGLSQEQVQRVVDAEADHQPHVGLVCVENTNMYEGGAIYPLSALRALRATTTLPIHMDGARLFNAVVASGTSAADFASEVDSVMSCLSKGLCAPVGSVLAGSTAFIEQARVERKRLGGAMRQAGFLAAAGLVALDTMVERLVDDHRRARRLADVVAELFPESNYDPSTCQTNIVAFNHPNARQLEQALAGLGVLAGTVGPTRLRFVTHAQVSDKDIEGAITALSTLRS